jgi:hypothetical protein
MWAANPSSSTAPRRFHRRTHRVSQSLDILKDMDFFIFADIGKISAIFDYGASHYIWCSSQNANFLTDLPQNNI